MSIPMVVGDYEYREGKTAFFVMSAAAIQERIALTPSNPSKFRVISSVVRCKGSKPEYRTPDGRKFLRYSDNSAKEIFE